MGEQNPKDKEREAEEAARRALKHMMSSMVVFSVVYIVAGFLLPDVLSAVLITYMFLVTAMMDYALRKRGSSMVHMGQTVSEVAKLFLIAFFWPITRSSVNRLYPIDDKKEGER